MNTDKFKEKIYGPYLDAWKIIKLLQYCTEHEGNWDAFAKEHRRFYKAYPDNKFADDLFNFLMTAAEDIRDMNEEEKNEMPI